MATRPGRRIIAAVSAALALSLSAVAATGASAAEEAQYPAFDDAQVKRPSDVTCSPIIVYAARGSSENPGVLSPRAVGQYEADGVTPRSRYYGGLGEELVPIYTRFRDLYAPGTVSLVTARAPQSTTLPGATDPQGPTSGPGYRGVGIILTLAAFYDYAYSENDGRLMVAGDLDTIHARCPDSKILALGYSAGAEVIRRALATLKWQPGAGKAMAMVFGDPTWKPREAGVSYVGDVDDSQFGSIRAAREGDFGFKISIFGFSISSIPDFPKAWNTVTYCHGGDLSCQYRGGTVTAHTTYHREDNDGAAFRAATFFGGPYVKPIVQARLSSTAVCYPKASTIKTSFKVTGAVPGQDHRISGEWEPTPFVAFPTITLSAAHPTADRESFAGLFPRFRLMWQGHKLDYRNWCA